MLCCFTTLVTNWWVHKSILRNTLNWTTLSIGTCSPILLCSHYLGHYATILPTYGCLGTKLQIICISFTNCCFTHIFLGMLWQNLLITNSTPMKKSSSYQGSRREQVRMIAAFLELHHHIQQRHLVRSFSIKSLKVSR